jgi:hypothetical protein
MSAKRAILVGIVRRLRHAGLDANQPSRAGRGAIAAESANGFVDGKQIFHGFLDDFLKNGVFIPSASSMESQVFRRFLDDSLKNGICSKESLAVFLGISGVRKTRKPHDAVFLEEYAAFFDELLPKGMLIPRLFATK